MADPRDVLGRLKPLLKEHRPVVIAAAVLGMGGAAALARLSTALPPTRHRGVSVSGPAAKLEVGRWREPTMQRSEPEALVRTGGLFEPAPPPVSVARPATMPPHVPELRDAPAPAIPLPPAAKGGRLSAFKNAAENGGAGTSGGGGGLAPAPSRRAEPESSERTLGGGAGGLAASLLSAAKSRARSFYGGVSRFFRNSGRSSAVGALRPSSNFEPGLGQALTASISPIQPASPAAILGTGALAPQSGASTTPKAQGDGSAGGGRPSGGGGGGGGGDGATTEDDTLCQPQTETHAPMSAAAGSKSGPDFHRTDFLTMKAGGEQIVFYIGDTAAKRQRHRAALKSRGYTHIYLDVIIEKVSGKFKDPPKPFDYLDRPQDYRPYLQELVSDKLYPILFLGVEDAPKAKAKYPPSKFAKAAADFVKGVDDLAAGYVLGVETKEYWKDSELDLVGKAVRAATRKQILVHPGRDLWQPALKPWSSGVAYFYGFGKSAAQIKKKTQDLAPKFHAAQKVFVAAEYALDVGEAKARDLGKAALEGGADGFGNGGPGAGGSSGGSTGGGGGDCAHGDDTKKKKKKDKGGGGGDDNGGGASSGKLCIEHSKAGKWPEKEGTEGNPWVFAQVGGKWHGATYEWLRPGQTCKGVGTDIGAYTKKNPLKSWIPAAGEQVGFMVSTPARSSLRTSNERSNVVLLRWGAAFSGKGTEDMLDLAQVKWLHADVRGWTKSSVVRKVTFKSSGGSSAGTADELAPETIVLGDGGETLPPPGPPEPLASVRTNSNSAPGPLPGAGGILSSQDRPFAAPTVTAPGFSTARGDGHAAGAVALPAGGAPGELSLGASLDGDGATRPPVPCTVEGLAGELAAAYGVSGSGWVALRRLPPALRAEFDREATARRVVSPLACLSAGEHLAQLVHGRLRTLGASPEAALAAFTQDGLDWLRALGPRWPEVQ
ncbi:MAG: hypothetical protein HY613_07355 [Candidatus Rokubacteria bacterium]|nr:hypothetical protein [Candidatus Rokubacteria bacterium]